MAKELMEIGGFITEGAEIVNHDASLSGNGTVDSPLGVVPLGLGDWIDVTSSMTKNTGVVTNGDWHFYYNKAMKLISIIGEIRATAAGDAYTIPEKYRPIADFVVSNHTGNYFINYGASTGKFTARSGTNGYFSIYCILPCTGE